MAHAHVIGGRTFIQVREPTVEQDYRCIAFVMRAGVDRLTLGPDESPVEFVDRIVRGVLAGGDALQMIACLLVPEDAIRAGAEPEDAWTPAIAEETARFIGKLKSGEDKAKVRLLLSSLLLGFFETGIVSLWTSKTSSGPAIPAATPPETSPGATGTGAASS